MNLFKRFIYYLIGVSFGSIVVYFIWKGKDVSFDYGMDARTLKTIRTKKLHYSENVKSDIGLNTIEFNDKLSAGVYTYSVQNEERIISKRMIISE